jgi:hypothetical protein
MIEIKKDAQWLILCDWLPPDFGAVGQYSLQRAQRLATSGAQVTLVGFSSDASTTSIEQLGAGSVRVIRIHRPAYDKSSLFARATWTIAANCKLLLAARRYMRTADHIIFTGSPPYFLHFIVPFNFLFVRRPLTYRITDFHPECWMAEFTTVPIWLRAIYRLTLFWRRFVANFEVLGNDQARRLREIGIGESRLTLLRDDSPVKFNDVQPMIKPAELGARKVLLYSGNFGVAHDHETFLHAFALVNTRWPGQLILWLNAVGKKADVVEARCKELQLPVLRSQPVSLVDLPALLSIVDGHLITLRDQFVGFVLPSKVYACIDSGRPILFIGSQESDVHELCMARDSKFGYAQAAVGDVQACVLAIEKILKLS